MKHATVAQVSIYLAPINYKPSLGVKPLYGDVYNWRENPYSMETEITRAIGLLEFFKEIEKNGGYPCVSSIESSHLTSLKLALREYRGDPKYRADLEWYVFWFDHALNTCVRPAIYFS
jgi:hypothetical protein